VLHLRPDRLTRRFGGDPDANLLTSLVQTLVEALNSAHL
jgi:hypothetical protein